MLREDECVSAKVMTNLGVSLSKLRSSVEFTMGRGEKQSSGEIGLTPRAKRVIELAIDEARQLGHNYIGTEHLLLGLLREQEGRYYALVSEGKRYDIGNAAGFAKTIAGLRPVQ